MDVGNFNGDAYDDLAIGVPGHDVNGLQDAGAVHIRFNMQRRRAACREEAPGVDSRGMPRTLDLATGDHPRDEAIGATPLNRR